MNFWVSFAIMYLGVFFVIVYPEILFVIKLISGYLSCSMGLLFPSLFNLILIVYSIIVHKKYERVKLRKNKLEILDYYVFWRNMNKVFPLFHY